MEVRELQYKKLVSFKDYGNEEFRVVVGVMPSEDVDEVADAARVIVESALMRSQRERDYAERVDDLKSQIERLTLDLALSDEEYIEQFQGRAGRPVDQDWLELQLQARADKRRRLAAYQQILADLERVGPHCDFESVLKNRKRPHSEGPAQGTNIISLPFADSVPDEEFEDDEEPCPF